MANRDERYEFQYDGEYLLALGRLTMNASYLEGSVRVMLWRLLGTGVAVGERLTVDANFRWLADHCEALAEYRLDGEVRERVIAWVRRAKVVYGKRSRIVHSSWYFDVTDIKEPRLGVERSTVRKGRLERTRELASADAMHEIARELEQVGLEGVRLMTPVIERFGPLPE
jgi:hypothetical protein